MCGFPKEAVTRQGHSEAIPRHHHYWASSYRLRCRGSSMYKVMDRHVLALLTCGRGLRQYFRLGPQGLKRISGSGGL